MNRALTLMRDDLVRVEAKFSEYLESDVPLIRKVGEYVLASGGKRIRPLLLLLCARLCGYSGSDRHVALAAVIEFIHTATLLHDDVVDDADLRRGNAAANTVWGNEASVLVGDFLLAKSFSIMVEGGDLRVLQIMSDATTKMAEGEMLQLISTCDVDMDEERYMNVIRTKTAVLIAAACRCGGFISGAGSADDAALGRFGMDLGVAFQLMDDALDYVAKESEFGKAQCHDLAEGKVTLPLIHALSCCNAAERARVEAILELPGEIPGEDIRYVCDLIGRYDGIAFTRKRAAELVASAKQALTHFPAGEVREALFELSDFVVQRNY